MEPSQVTQHARALYNAHGDKSEAEAAQKAKACRDEGKIDEADDWTAIREAIRILRGANQS
jgi:hypothetical protein